MFCIKRSLGYCLLRVIEGIETSKERLTVNILLSVNLVNMENQTVHTEYYHCYPGFIVKLQIHWSQDLGKKMLTG